MGVAAAAIADRVATNARDQFGSEETSLARTTRTARKVSATASGTESLTDRAYKVLEERIVTLKLAPGAVLSENTLVAELGFGRTPIREALHRLARESLIIILPRRGILVSEINPRNQLLVLEVRRELERLMARAGALRATAEEKARFLEIAEAMERAARGNNDLSFMRLDSALNILVSKAAHNDYASRAIGLLNGLSRRFWFMHYKEAADLPLCARLHAQLARRIASGDPDEAGRASDKLVDYVEAFTRATLGPSGLARHARKKTGPEDQAAFGLSGRKS